MRKADRLFQMVNLIRVHQPITAANLAERLEVSVRTVYRYIDDLSLGGIPVYGEPGLGYAMHQGFEMPPLNLNGNELEALAVAVELMSTTVGFEFAQHARSMRAKIEAALPAPRSTPVHLPIATPWATLTPHAMRCWDRLRQAIHDRQAVRIDYTSLQAIPSSRDVYPLGLFYWGGKWTLGAWCMLRQDYRDFRVDLIRQLTPVRPFEPRPPQANLEEYRARQVQAWREATDKTLSAGLVENGSSVQTVRSDLDDKSRRA